MLNKIALIAKVLRQKIEITWNWILIKYFKIRQQQNVLLVTSTLRNRVIAVI